MSFLRALIPRLAIPFYKRTLDSDKRRIATEIASLNKDPSRSVNLKDGCGYWLVEYTYDPATVLEQRAPLRPAHLALCQEYADKGHLLLGGAKADPIDGATIIFRGSREQVEEFLRKDPYVCKGLVTKHTLRKWTVVIGALLTEK